MCITMFVVSYSWFMVFIHAFHRLHLVLFFFFNDTATTEIYTLSLHDALPILLSHVAVREAQGLRPGGFGLLLAKKRSEEHTSELQSRLHLVCRLLLEKKKNENHSYISGHFRFHIAPLLDCGLALHDARIDHIR